MHLLSSVQVQNQDPAADGVFTHDLAVNPLSVVLIHLRPLNETSTLTNWQSYLGIADAINRVNIMHNGMSVVSLTGRDAAMLAYFRHGIMPLQNEGGETDNIRRCVTIPILMGRRPYDPKSCFPATRAGELIMELDLDVASAGYDDLQYTVETIEILGAKPTEWERKVSLSQTFAATGPRTFDLPVNNLFRGCLLFGTTAFAGATPVPSWGRVALRVDGVEMGYSGVDFETLHAYHSLLGIQPPAWDAHTHLVDATQADASEETHTGPIDVGAGGYENYAFLDLDPTGDDMFSIDTSRVSRLQLASEVETADAVRVVPIERVKVA